MPVVFGDVKNVARIPLDGVVWVSSPEWRPGGTSVISMNRKTYAISGGVFRTDDLVPGPCVFEFRGDGDGQVRRQRYEFVVPDQEGELNFLDLLDTSYEYPAPVVGQAQAAAREARASADEARAGADRVGSAERVLEAESAAKAAVEAVGEDRRAVAADRAAVAGDRAVVEAARDDAVASVNEAVSEASDTALAEIGSQVQATKAYRDEAKGFKDETWRFKSATEKNAGVAAGAASEAKASAVESASSAELAAQYKSEGEALLVQGRSLSEKGAADADRAEAARTEAEEYKNAAWRSQKRASEAADAAAASAENAALGAPEGGWTKAQLHVNVQSQLDKVDSLPSEQAVRSMISDKADSSALAAGLAGKLDNQPVSENATQSTLVKRTGEGRIKAANGVASDDVVTFSQMSAAKSEAITTAKADSKSYVDGLISSAWQSAACVVSDDGDIADVSGTRKFQWSRMPNGDIRLVGEFSFGDGFRAPRGGDIRMKGLPGSPFLPAGIRVFGSGDMTISGIGRFLMVPYCIGSEIRFLVPASGGSSFQAPMRLWDGSTADTSYPSGVNLYQSWKGNTFRFDITYPST